MELSYEEFLRRTREQEARDRDRFTGHDSHEAQPVYDARSGDLVLNDAALADLHAAMQTIIDGFRQFMASLTTALQPAIDAIVATSRELERLAAEPPPKRHTYPKPHREWWNRR